jgi:hypothetical protein
VEIITTDSEFLEAPPAKKRWTNIWKHELEFAIKDKENLLPPDYNEIKRQRKRKKVTVKPKRKTKKKKKGKR